MDTSSEYIKQCKKAGEIQKGWKPQVGDFSTSKWLTEKYKIKPFPAYEDTANGDELIHGLVWLPRQDQLQEMVDIQKFDLPCGFTRDYILATEFGKWVLKQDPYCASSMEQLWLAFVMKEKFNKTWNGEDWV